MKTQQLKEAAMQLPSSYPYYIGGEARKPNEDLAITDKYTQQVAARVAQADRAAVEEAIAQADAAAGAMRAMKAYQRQAILHQVRQEVQQRRQELAMAVCIEAGKPIRDALGEVDRLIDTFRIAAEEAVRIGGEVIPLDITPRAAAYVGMTRRVPIGPCSLITPFNFPLNLVAHKIAPAIAAGCPFVLKPSPLTPLGALILGEILAQTDLPRGAFSIVTCSNEDAAPLVEDDRIKLLSFTGSDRVGWMLKARAGRKKVLLELGGNAGVIVDEDADLDDALPRLVTGAFYQSGQSCISVQRIYVHESIYDAFRERFVAAVSRLKMGDPRQEDTFIGPMISEKEAARLEGWVREAVERGGKILCGGKRQGLMHEPTVLENVPCDASLYGQEAFGPVALLEPFSDFDEALDRLNDSRFGLQAGVFTRDLHKAYKAWDRLEVGAVLIGEAPSWRVDHMPYGGVKHSGLGREGPRYVIEEMTEVRFLVIRQPQA